MSDFTVKASLSGKAGASPFASSDVAKGHDCTTTPPQKYAVTISVGTSAQALSLGAVSDCKALELVNLDPLNYIDVAIDSGMINKFAKIEPGFPLLIQPAAGVTYYLKANTAACRVEVTAVDA